MLLPLLRALNACAYSLIQLAKLESVIDMIIGRV